jgi:uncharacterized protein (TIGR02722 family)
VSLDRQPMTHRLEPQDIRRTVENMVASMQQDISSEDLSEFGYTIGSRPILDIFPVRNNTSQHLDMQSFTDSLRNSLNRTRMFRFVDRSTSQNDITIINEQVLGGLTDPNLAIRPGQQFAAQMTITGAVSEMKTRNGRVTDAYYNFSLQLKDLRTGVLIWTDEQEIRKETVRPRF